MQKLYRDSKGRFVSREVFIKELTTMLAVTYAFRGARPFIKFSETVKVRVDQLSINKHQFASLIRQFRIKHGIYECF